MARDMQTIVLTDNTGAWAIHVVIIVLAKIFFDILPGMWQELSWTLVNLSYVAGTYLMFHYVRGVPFDFNSGAFDNLNMWEQIDNGDQYTPAKKFLLTVPVVLFLVSTHYTHYETTYFIVNCVATLCVVIPKLPSVCTAPTQLVRVLTCPAAQDTILLLQHSTRRRLVGHRLIYAFSGLGVITLVFLVNPAAFGDPTNWVHCGAGVASGAYRYRRAEDLLIDNKSREYVLALQFPLRHSADSFVIADRHQQNMLACRSLPVITFGF
jgi:hypothetical protein